MKATIKGAIKRLTHLSGYGNTSLESSQYSQAALNLAHALDILHSLDNALNAQTQGMARTEQGDTESS